MCSFSHAYCLYSIGEDVVDLQCVAIRESWQVSVEDHPGHLALWLTAIQFFIHPIHPVISCTDSRPVLVKLSGDG